MITKGQCMACSGHLEFEAEHAGTQIECPHCGEQTELRITQRRLITPIPRPRRNVAKLVIILVIVLVLTAVIALALYYGGEAIGSVAAVGIGGGIYLLFWIAAIVLAVFWLLFPVLVYYQLKKANELLGKIEQNTRPK